MSDTKVSQLISTIADFVNVCGDGDFRSDHGFVGDAYPRTDVWFLAWFVDVFVQDKAHKARLLGAMRAVDDFVADFGRYHYQTTGEPVRIPPAITDELKRRILRGYFPGVDEIVKEAKHGQPLRAQHALFRTFREDAWRMRSGS